MRAGHRLDAGPWWAHPKPATPLWVAFAVAAGIAFGAAVAVTPTAAILVSSGLTAAAVAAGAVGWPPLVPAAFWLAFSLQQTLFYGFSVTGLYYPVYLLMAVNVVVAILLSRLRLELELLWPYLVFLVAVVVSLLSVPESLDFDGYQRLFAYVMGLLVYVQFAGRRGWGFMAGAQVVAALAIAAWVIVSSIETGFTYRGGVSVDQNEVSFLLGFGLIVMLAHLMAASMRPWLRIIAWVGLGLGSYALLLLASRGVSLAFAAAAIAMFARISGDARRSLPILATAVVAALLLLALPGSDALFERFSGSDVATANDRIPLWRGAIDAYTSSNLYQSLFGRGFDTSEDVVRAVTATVTSTHNAYLQLLVELGLFGVVAFVGVHVALFVRFWRTRTAMGLYGLGVVLYMSVADLSLTVPNNFVYWLAIGFLIALGSDSRWASAAGGDRMPNRAPGERDAAVPIRTSDPGPVA